MPASLVVEARGVSRVFPMSAGPVTALRDVTLHVAAGEYVAIAGPSGCGKSTLLHLVGCVDTPSSGSILFERRDVAALSEGARSRIRLTRIGFVFQRFFLLPMLTAAENIELPQAEAGVAPAARRARTRALLEYVELV
ncbi:MAG: macrolide ABC transporter ATP-binding protein, partial [Acidobacteria bacterium]